LVLNIVIAEAALEAIPGQIIGHASVRSDARRRGVEPSRILLDRSIHHAAMVRLDEGLKRGRPDLVHLTLLNITSTPLYQEGRAKVYIHTRDDIVLDFQQETRPPKSYFRFRDLVQQLLADRPEGGLVRVYDASIRRLLEGIRTDLKVGLSIQGGPSRFEELAADLTGAKNPTVLIGGFPKGHFTPETTKELERLVRIDERPLDAHVVAARLVYEVEKADELDKKGVV
jgi:rRNA small subunit pseudouridine methyltransferase Nep1